MIRQHGSIPLVTWEPGDGEVLNKANQPAYSLKNIINGNFDSYITQWARLAKAWGNPFFLRFAHEMNGNWYPWSEGVNGNATGDYAKAWRHVHDIFVREGVTNATWVWHQILGAIPRSMVSIPVIATLIGWGWMVITSVTLNLGAAGSASTTSLIPTGGIIYILI